MSLWTKLLDKVGLEIKARATINSIMGAEISLLGIGSNVFIRDAYKANPNIFSTISWITQRVARTKWQLFDVSNKKEKKELFDHPILELLENPNPAQSKTEFLESACGYKKITGETFIQGVSPGAGINQGKPKELWVLPTPMMDVKFDRSGIPIEFVILSKGKKNTIPAEEIMYLRQFNPGEGNRGMSNIQAGIKVVSQSNSAYEANMRLIQNLGAQGILTLDDPNANADQGQIDLMETKINQKHGGASNYGKVMVSSTAWKWQQIGLNATDLALIESQKMSLRDICNLFNLNSQLFNDPDNTTYNNIQEARKAGITDAVQPEIEALRDGFNKWLVPKFGTHLRLDYDQTTFPELQKNQKELTEWLSQAWWLTGNQKLQIMKMAQNDNPIMNEILIPTNLIPTGTPDDLEKAYSRHLEISELGKLISSNGNGS